MNKWIITFGSSHLEGFDVNPMKVMLVIEAESENEARSVAQKDPFNNAYCSSYNYDEHAERFTKSYHMVEYNLNELLALRQ